MSAPGEQFIGTVDTRDLSQLRWPLIRLFFPRFVEEVELGRYVKRILASGRWRMVRLVPHPDGDGLSAHKFDLYGQPAGPAE